MRRSALSFTSVTSEFRSPYQDFRENHILCVVLLPFMLLALWWLDGYVCTRSDNVKEGTHYLGRAGIFLVMWIRIAMLRIACQIILINGPSLMMTYAQFKQMKRFGFITARESVVVKLLYFYQVDPLEENMFPALAGVCDRLNGMSDDTLRSVLSSGDGMRVAKLVVLFGHVVVNCAFMYLNFTSLPDRDPFEPLNQAKHYVVYFECTVMAIFVLRLMATLVQSLLSDFRGGAAVFATRFKAAAGWSAFHLLQHVNPTNVMTDFDNLRSRASETISAEWSAVIAALWILMFTLVIGGVGVLAMVVKLSQLGFVQETLVWKYGIHEATRLAGFTLNVVSIVDRGDIAKQAVHRFLVQDKEYWLHNADPLPIWVAWEQHLSGRIAKTFGSGFKSFIIMATLTVDDIRRLLIQQQPQPPELLRKALAADATVLDQIPFSERAMLTSSIKEWIAARIESNGRVSRKRSALLEAFIEA